MAKNRELFVLGADVLQDVLQLLSYAEIKQSDLPQVVGFLSLHASKLGVPDNRVVHWDTTKLELLTIYTTELTRHALLLGKEVNRIRMGQRRPIKDFIKEAQSADEYAELQKRIEEVDDAHKRATQ